MADIRAPLYLLLPDLRADLLDAAECPVCFAVVLAAKLDDHKQAAHG